MTPANERKAKERQAKRDAGLVRVEVWVPEGWEHCIRHKAEMYREIVEVDPLPSVTTP